MIYKKNFIFLFSITLIIFLFFFVLQNIDFINYIEKVLLIILLQKEQNYSQFLILIILLNFFYFLTPLPVFPLILFNGFIFGLFGFIFSILYISLCSILIFYFANICLKKNFSKFNYFKYIKKKIKKYKFIKELNFFTIFISRYIIPYFFHNIIFGLTNLNIKKFFFIVVLAEIPLTLATNSMGKSLNSFVLIDNYNILQLFLNYEFIIPFFLILFIVFITSTFKRSILKKFDKKN